MRTDDMFLDDPDVVTTRRSAVRIAGVTFVADARDEGLRLDVQPGLLPFSVETDSGDTEFGVHYQDPPAELESDPGTLVFDSTAGWCLYEREDSYVFTFALSPPDPGPVQRPTGIAVFDRAFRSGEFYQRPRGVGEARWHGDGSVSIFPWHRPFYELLMLNRIAQLDGLHVHASGIVLGRDGYLFPGMSGSGKSTFAGLWAMESVPVLSDERLIIRRHAEGITMYGTPWSSSADASLADQAPLRGVYFLEHASENAITPLSAAEVVRLLMVRCFPVFYFREGMESTLRLVAHVAATVPAYRFGFVPDESATAFFRERVSAG